MFCPNISNPKVRSEFNELVTAFGGTPMTEEEFRDSELRNKRQGSEYAAMEAAYRVWDRNNGNAIDSAPNGAPSLLFQDILSRSKDRNDAIYRKTALYTKSFSDKYGEWYNTENKENKITLDVNGEPSIEDANVQKTVGITLKENKEQRVAEALSRFSFDRTLGNDITEMFRNGDNVSSQKVITRLVSQNTLSLGDLRIANILAKHDIPIVIETNKTSDRIAYTVTDSKGNSIVVLNANLMSKVTSQYAAITILHEVSHAVTVNAIDNPSTKEERRFTEMNSKMFHTFRNIAERLHWPLDNVDNGMYAFTNEKEFAACFISDNNVRSLCLEIARKSDTKVSTRIKNFINSIVNLFVNKNIFDTNTSLYNQYTKEMTEYLENKEVVSNNSEEISTALDEYKNRDKRALMEQSFIQFFENNTKLMKIYQQNALVANQYTKSAKQNTINHISDVLQTRIKALRAMSKDSTNKRNENINSLTGIIDALDNVNVDTFTALTLLRNTLAPQLSSDIDNIKKLYNNGYKFSGEEYMHHLHENVNVHADIAKSIEQMLGDEFTVNLIVDEHNKLHKDSPITKEDVETFRQIASAYGARANEGTNVLNKIRDEVVADTLEQVKRETSALDLDDTIRAFRESGNTLGEDLGWFEGIGLGAADASASPLIRASYHLLNDAFNAAEEETNDVMDDYLRSVKGLKLSKLYERAKDGSLTGYLKRRINFG